MTYTETFSNLVMCLHQYVLSATAAAGRPTDTANDDNVATKEVDAAAEKRRAIQAIMRDATLTDLERRLRIQQLMDGSSKANIEPGGISSILGSGSSSSAATLTSTLLPNGRLNNGSSSLGSASMAGAAVGGGGGDHNNEVMACVHYERKCNVVAPCCGGVYGCRVCHDEMSSGCGPMDRFGIKEIVCKECNTRQDSK